MRRVVAVGVTIARNPGRAGLEKSRKSPTHRLVNIRRATIEIEEQAAGARKLEAAAQDGRHLRGAVNCAKTPMDAAEFRRRGHEMVDYIAGARSV